MPESSPATLAEEWRIQQTIQNEALDQEPQTIIFDVAEHGSANHVCTPECNHTQTEADQFAGNLFSEIKPALHGEKGHVCDANCQHSQAEADKFAELMFTEVKSKVPEHHLHKHEATQHGEKGHVCTAECQHSQSEADEFASKLFEASQKATQHGEKGHVCDANCQHSQAEADKFAEDLFSTSIRQEKTVKDVIDANTVVSETQIPNRVAEKNSANTNIDRLSIIERQYQAEQDVLEGKAINEQSVITEQGLDLSLNMPRATERSSIKAEPALEGTMHSSEEGNYTLPTAMKLNEMETEEIHAESIFMEQTTVETEIPAKSIVLEETEMGETIFELPQSDTSSLVETIDESNVELNDIADFNEAVASYISDSEILMNEVLSLEGNEDNENTNQYFHLTNEVDVTTHQQPNETESTDEFTSEKIVENIPELAPIKQLLPIVVETLNGYVEADAGAELEQTSQKLDELIALIDNGIETNNLTDIDIVFVHEKVEELAKLLGLKSELLEETLQIQENSPFMPSIALEILQGLKKHLSIEYSLEFALVSSSQIDDTSSPFIRVLGRLLLNVLSQSNHPAPLLASS